MFKFSLALASTLLVVPFTVFTSTKSADQTITNSTTAPATQPSTQEHNAPHVSDHPLTDMLVPTVAMNIDRSCDHASYPSKQWTQCEIRNYERTLEAPVEQLSLEFQKRYSLQSAANMAEWTARTVADRSWLSWRSGNSFLTPLCASLGLPCTGDPFRYPDAEGEDGRVFYEQQAQVEDVVFYDRDCARISARIWLPKEANQHQPVPAVVITNGSIQAPQTVYYWAAQTLVRSGYAVMTYDPRGQGRSDMQTPKRVQGSNLNPKVFWEGQVDAIDFFRSSPTQRYPHQASCAGTYRTKTASYNPYWDSIDHDRLGIAGHSLGAIGVSVVQGYGALGADAWPGMLDETNPVKVAVGWDSLITPDGSGLGTVANFQAPPLLYDAAMTLLTQNSLPNFAPRVPALSFFADYGGVPAPYLAPPEPTTNLAAFDAWQKAGVDSYAVGFQGTTHFDFSLLPTFPASSWCPDASSGSCRGGWGQPSIQYYTLAWFDRWLKQPGEQGYDDADQRLLDDAWQGGAERMSYHYQSARNFVDRQGNRHTCRDIRAGCSIR